MGGFVLLFGLFHLLPMGLAVWGAFSKRPWIHVPAILVLMSELLGHSISGAFSWDGIVSGQLAWWLVGPAFLPLEILQAIPDAPLWVLPLLAVGIVVGVAVWRWLSRQARLRTWAFAAVLAGCAASWIVAEISVETAMRVQAGQQFEGYCNFARLPAPMMLAAGRSDFAVPPYGTLVDRSHHYLWSFKQGRWIMREACSETPCWCYRGSHGLQNSPRATGPT